MKMLLRFLIFLALNFGALAIGGLFTAKGVPSDWYQQLNKAPWTPPGWVFGAAWSTIMLCFSVYLARLWQVHEAPKKLVPAFALQWVLNVSWNPLFFFHHYTWIGLAFILALTIWVWRFLFIHRKAMGAYSLLLLPYGVWLLIATSLNAYVCFYN